MGSGASKNSQSSGSPVSLRKARNMKSYRSFASSSLLDHYNKLLFMSSHHSASTRQPSILVQLEIGVRGFEFTINCVNGELQLSGKREDYNLSANNISSTLLSEWLAVITKWSKINVDHSPITIWLTLKENVFPKLENGFETLNRFVHSLFGDSLFTVDDFREKRRNWPSGKELVGRVLFVLTGNNARLNYMFENGLKTDISMSSDGKVVEIHSTQNDEIYFWLGRLCFIEQEKSVSSALSSVSTESKLNPSAHIEWTQRGALPCTGLGKTAIGKSPKVSVSICGVVSVYHRLIEHGLEMSDSENVNDEKGEIWYHVGLFSSSAPNTLEWSGGLVLCRGLYPSVAVNDMGLVVVMFREVEGDKAFCRIGQLDGKVIKWQNNQTDLNRNTLAFPPRECIAATTGPLIHFSPHNPSHLIMRHFTGKRQKGRETNERLFETRAEIKSSSGKKKEKQENISQSESIEQTESQSFYPMWLSPTQFLEGNHKAFSVRTSIDKSFEDQTQKSISVFTLSSQIINSHIHTIFNLVVEPIRPLQVFFVECASTSDELWEHPETVFFGCSAKNEKMAIEAISRGLILRLYHFNNLNCKRGVVNPNFPSTDFVDSDWYIAYLNACGLSVTL